MKRIIAVFALVASLAAARAEDIIFTVNLGGNQETPPSGSFAGGGGVATFDTVASTIDLTIYFAGLAVPATASHIHDGALGVAGPIILNYTPYTPNATSGLITSGGALAFPAANVADLLAGNTYFNIHDASFPGGEIRGQLVATPEPSTLALAGLATVFGFWKLRRR